MQIRIFIESSIKGPAIRDGVSMWLVEWKVNGEPKTLQGFVHVKEGTEAKAELMALINAFYTIDSRITKNASALVFTKCKHVFHTIGNGLYTQWEKNGWKNAKGKPAANAELWQMLIDKTLYHAFTVSDEHHEYEKVMQDDIKKELDMQEYGIVRDKIIRSVAAVLNLQGVLYDTDKAIVIGELVAERVMPFVTENYKSKTQRRIEKKVLTEGVGT